MTLDIYKFDNLNIYYITYRNKILCVTNVFNLMLSHDLITFDFYRDALSFQRFQMATILKKFNLKKNNNQSSVRLRLPVNTQTYTYCSDHDTAVLASMPNGSPPVRQYSKQLYLSRSSTLTGCDRGPSQLKVSR